MKGPEYKPDYASNSTAECKPFDAQQEIAALKKRVSELIEFVHYIDGRLIDLERTPPNGGEDDV